MAFTEIEIGGNAKTDSRTGCSVSLVKMRSAPAKLRVLMLANMIETMGFAADPAALLRGAA